MSEIKITIKGKKKTYPKGIKVLEIAKDNSEVCFCDILGCRINNETISMEKELFTDTKIDFFDVTDVVGYKMYQAGLKFLFEVAVKKIDAKAEVTYLHSVPKGIYLELETGKDIDHVFVSKVKENMAALISADIPFRKFNILKTEAMQYYKDKKYFEKAKGLSFIYEDVITMYGLENHLNYFYTEMPYSTSALRKFDIKYLDKNKFVLIFPSKRSDGNIPEYVHYDKLVATFRKTDQWLKSQEIEYLSDMNDLVSESKIKDFIAINELKFNEDILNIANKIAEQKNAKIILIAGPSSSGKTTTTKRLASYMRLKGFSPIQISIDDYFVNREETPKDAEGKYDYECLQAIDLELFNQNLKDLLKGKEVEIPIYNFISGRRELVGKKVKLKENSILLIEGLHTLNDELTPNIPNKYKFKIYLSPFMSLNLDRHNYVSTVDLRLIRRMIRDNRTRGAQVTQTIEQWQSVRNGEEKYIFPYIPQADIIINTSLSYELGILKVYVEPLLYAVEINSPYYEEAKRLIKSLKAFFPITSEYVPKDSILREFIGYGE